MGYWIGMFKMHFHHQQNFTLRHCLPQRHTHFRLLPNMTLNECARLDNVFLLGPSSV